MSLIEDIKKSVEALNQKNLFGNSEEQLEKACVAYLKHKGYEVVAPKKFERTIKNLDDLVNYFYLLMNSKHPDFFASSYNINKDRAIAKKFVESRMSVKGTGKEYALNECGAIIKTVLDYEEEFNFKFTPTFSIFGQDKLGWVTNRAIEILNKKEVAKKEAHSEELRQQVIESQDMSDLGIGNLDEILARMEEDENG